ncbi:MAG TPA: hypothetical protein VJJ28_00455 [Candidatus Paceibacterota bacterium]
MLERKQKLLELEKTNKYFFHGSEKEIDIFKPHQAYNWRNGVKEKDGEPATFASPSVNYAIFMAIFNKKNCPNELKSGVKVSAENIESNKFEITFETSRGTLANLVTNATGYVYVFDRKDFPKRNSPAEYMSHSEVTPLEKILVTKEDLSKLAIL